MAKSVTVAQGSKKSRQIECRGWGMFMARDGGHETITVGNGGASPGVSHITCDCCLWF